MRKTLGVCLLTVLLIGSVSAGEMPNWTPSPAAAPTPTQPVNTAQESDTTDSTTDDAQDSVTESVLLALLSVLL